MVKRIYHIKYPEGNTESILTTEILQTERKFVYNLDGVATGSEYFPGNLVCKGSEEALTSIYDIKLSASNPGHISDDRLLKIVLYKMQPWAEARVFYDSICLENNKSFSDDIFYRKLRSHRMFLPLFILLIFVCFVLSVLTYMLFFFFVMFPGYLIFRCIIIPQIDAKSVTHYYFSLPSERQADCIIPMPDLLPHHPQIQIV